MAKIEIEIGKGVTVRDLIGYLQDWCYSEDPLGKEDDEIVSINLDRETQFSSRMGVLED